MEAENEEDIYSIFEDSLLSDDECSKDFFDNLLEQNNIMFAPHNPSQMDLDPLEADPLLSEAQLIDGQTLLDAFDIRIPQPQHVPKMKMLEPLPPLFNRSSKNSESDSFDEGISFTEDTSPLSSPNTEETPEEVPDPGEDVNEAGPSCSNNTENNTIDRDVQLDEEISLNFDLCSSDSQPIIISPELINENQPSLVIQPDANMNSVDTSDDTNDGNACSYKSDLLQKNPPYAVEISFRPKSAVIVFKNAAGDKVLATQVVLFPHERAKKLLKQVHKILNVRQVQLCKHLDYMLPVVQTDLGAKIYLCPANCVRAYIYVLEAKMHTLNHLSIKSFMCDQPECIWKFYTPSRLARHISTHIKQKNFGCTICLKRFTTIYNLNEHKKKHNTPPTLKCPVVGCNSMFQNERQRLGHCHRNHKPSDAPFRCTLNKCKKAFFTKVLLEAHARNCSRRASEVVCSTCGKMCNTPYRLREHTRQHTGVRPYRCHYENCPWSFTTASKLKRHQCIHTRERKFHCTIDGCKKSFLRSEHLKDHTLTHIDKNTFDGKPITVSQMKNNSEKKVECTKACPNEEEEDLSTPSPSAEELLEQAIKSLGMEMMDTDDKPEEPVPLLIDGDVSTVNLCDLN